MDREDIEALSAFFDGEFVPKRALLRAFRHRDAPPFLSFMIWARDVIRGETSAPPNAWVRQMRARVGSLSRGEMECHESERDSQMPRAGRPVAEEIMELSKREVEVIECLLRGCSEKEAAIRLCITPSTVHGHMKRLHRKLGVHNRVELLAAVGRLR